MPAVPQSQASRQLAELLGVAQQWAPAAARMAGGTPVTAPLGEATAARLEGREPTWEELLFAAGLAAIPAGWVLQKARRGSGSTLGRILDRAKAKPRGVKSAAISAHTLTTVADSVGRDAAPGLISGELRTGAPVTMRLYRGSTGDPIPGRGMFLTADPGDAASYLTQRLSQNKWRSPRERRWQGMGPAQLGQQFLRQYDVTLQNPVIIDRVGDVAIDEPADFFVRMAKTNPDHLLEAGIPAQVVAKMDWKGSIPFRSYDRLMQKYLAKYGYDAAVFPASRYVVLAEKGAAK